MVVDSVHETWHFHLWNLSSRDRSKYLLGEYYDQLIMIFISSIFYWLEPTIV